MKSASKKAQQIKSFIAMDIIELAEAMEREGGGSVISFALGEPDFDAPECVKEACMKAIRENKTKYTHSQGLVELREEIAKHYYEKYSVSVHPDRILVTQGTSPAFFLIFSTLLEKGDEVILPNPHYPCDANFVSFLDGTPVYAPVHESHNYQWDSREIKKRITPKTRALFVTSPSNPTGAVLSRETLKKISSLGVPVVSDELYHGLVYEGQEHTMMEFSKNSFVVNGFSKAYAMTGFRLGYLIAPQKYMRPLQKVAQNFYISANTFVQYAGIAALQKAGGDLVRMKKEFNRRRLAMKKGLLSLGFDIGYEPTGAFYFFVKIPETWPLAKSLRPAKGKPVNSYNLAFDILKKARVGITPGIDFGSEGEGHLRFSYAVSVEKIEEGISRLKKYLHQS